MGLGEFVQGAAGGAMAGSAFGPWGTAIGGGIGGLATLFGGNGARDRYQSQLQGLANSYGGRQPYEVQQAGDSSFRGDQQNLVSQLQALSSGRGPSLADAQMRATTDRNQKQAQAIGAQAGPNAALSQFRAQNAQAGLGAQAAQDSVASRIAEEQMAMNQLGLVLQGARGQDQSLATFNAGSVNQARQFQSGLNDSSQLAALQMLGGQVQQPTLGERILAGGAGAYGQWAGNRAARQNQGGANAAFTPGAGGVLPMGAFGGPGQQQAPDPYGQWWQQHGG